MNILITNDDGIQSPILPLLAEFIMGYGDVYVVAPDSEKSGVGHGFTFHHPLQVKEVTGFPCQAKALSGTPADCVKFAHCQLISAEIDLVISGVNHGHNAGVAVFYSGTVAGAREGALWNIPALALSIDDINNEHAWPKIKVWLQKFMDNKTYKSIKSYWNVNFPNASLDWEGELFCSMSQVMYEDKYIKKDDGYYLQGFKPQKFIIGTDDWALSKNKISITPLFLDATNYNEIENTISQELNK